jgi:hypothetical protein
LLLSLGRLGDQHGGHGVASDAGDWPPGPGIARWIIVGRPFEPRFLKGQTSLSNDIEPPKG